jgi:hypothetical protein
MNFGNFSLYGSIKGLHRVSSGEMEVILKKYIVPNAPQRAD